MKHEIDKLVELARKHRMSPDEIRDQRRSFVYGNTHIENQRITREMVIAADEKLNPED
ncbi:MAG: hypothetical protein P1U37_14730 [Minwuia sp.]|nr:hypothetical protein [Minwuia sp.]